MHSRTVAMALAVAVAAVGCAHAPVEPSSAGGGAELSSSPSPSPSSVACPQMEGIELPPECIPYDPQALMDANERYRERLPVHPESFAAFEAVRPAITAGLEQLQQEDGLSPDAVRGVLIDGGLLHENPDGVNAWEDGGTIVFNGVGPVGGCVFGTVSTTDLELDIRGVIMDGGCHEAFAH